jgi:hypothetical protein
VAGLVCVCHVMNHSALHGGCVGRMALLHADGEELAEERQRERERDRELQRGEWRRSARPPWLVASLALGLCTAPCPPLLLSGAGCLFLAGAVAAVAHVDEAACAFTERDREIDLEIERERQRQRQRKAEMAAEIERERERMRSMQRAKAERQVSAACVPASGVEVARAAGCFALAYPSPRLASALPALACLPSQPPTQPCRALPCLPCPAAVSTACTTSEGGMRRGGSRVGASGGCCFAACWAGARAHRDRGGRCPRGSALPLAPCSASRVLRTLALWRGCRRRHALCRRRQRPRANSACCTRRHGWADMCRV